MRGVLVQMKSHFLLASVGFRHEKVTMKYLKTIPLSVITQWYRAETAFVIGVDTPTRLSLGFVPQTQKTLGVFVVLVSDGDVKVTRYRWVEEARVWRKVMKQARLRV